MYHYDGIKPLLVCICMESHISVKLVLLVCVNACCTDHCTTQLFLLLFTSFPGSLGGILPPNSSTPSAGSMPSKESQPQGDRKKAKALYDYDASDPSELSLLADEVSPLLPHWLILKEYCKM